LFSVRGTWRAAELDPYLRPLIEHQPQPQQQPSKGQRQMSSQQSSTENNEEEEAQTIISKRIENLMLKHCRVAKKGRGGEKLYSLRDLGMDSF
jgi:hypothetical protein